MNILQSYVNDLKERIDLLETTLVKIESMCDWVDRDRTERDKVLLNVQSIRFEIARAYPKYLREDKGDK